MSITDADRMTETETTKYAIDVDGKPLCWHANLFDARRCGVFEEEPTAMFRPYTPATAEQIAEYAGLVLTNDCRGGIRVKLRDALRRIENRDIPEATR